MAAARLLHIALPQELADFVSVKVTSGDYATESAVIEAALRTLQDRDAALEDWLRREVVPAYEELQADPSRGIPLDEVQAALDAAWENDPDREP